MKSLSQLREDKQLNKRNIEIAKAEAKQLWENPLLQATLAKLDEESIRVIDKAPLFGVPFFWRTIQTLMFRQVTNRFKKHLQQALTDVALEQRNTQ